MNPVVSIIILNYNGERFLSEVLKNLYETQYSPFEIIVVDNNSSDNSLQILSNFSDIRLIVNKENLGFAEGNNVGIRAAKGEYIALVNNDLKVTPNWLSPLIDFLEKNKEYAAVQPKILSWQEPSEFEYAGGAGGFIDRYGYPFSRGRILRKCEIDMGQYDDPIDIFWASGACIVVRKSVIDEVGMLDSDFFLHQEEIDWCWRMLLRGYKIKAIPKSIVYHYGGGSLNYDHPFKLYLNYRNNLAMLLKNRERAKILAILPIRILLDFGAFFHNILQGKWKNAWSIVKGYFYVIFHIKSILKKRKWVQEKIKNISDHQLESLIFPGSIILSYYTGKKSFERLHFNGKK